MSENSYLMQFYEINICQLTIFNLYTVHDKYDDDKNFWSNQRKIASIVASVQIILLLTVIQQISLVKHSPNTRRTRKLSEWELLELKDRLPVPVWQSSVYSAVWCKKLTMSPMILEYSPVSLTLLVLELRKKNFLEH